MYKMNKKRIKKKRILYCWFTMRLELWTKRSFLQNSGDHILQHTLIMKRFQQTICILFFIQFVFVFVFVTETNAFQHFFFSFLVADKNHFQHECSQTRLMSPLLIELWFILLLLFSAWKYAKLFGQNEKVKWYMCGDLCVVVWFKKKIMFAIWIFQHSKNSFVF